jgi:hypothetical protein
MTLSMASGSFESILSVVRRLGRKTFVKVLLDCERGSDQLQSDQDAAPLTLMPAENHGTWAPSAVCCSHPARPSGTPAPCLPMHRRKRASRWMA